MLNGSCRKEENKKLQKSEICIFEDVDTLTKINVKVTVKAKALSCWIFENVPNENCSFLTEKMTKTEGKISPKILLEKNEERKNKMSEEKERRRRKKSIPSFYFDFFGNSF